MWTGADVEDVRDQFTPARCEADSWNLEVEEIPLAFNLSHRCHRADPTKGRMAPDWTTKQRLYARSAPVAKSLPELRQLLDHHYDKDGKCRKTKKGRYIAVAPGVAAG